MLRKGTVLIMMVFAILIQGNNHSEQGRSVPKKVISRVQYAMAHCLKGYSPVKSEQSYWKEIDLWTSSQDAENENSAGIRFFRRSEGPVWMVVELDLHKLALDYGFVRENQNEITIPLRYKWKTYKITIGIDSAPWEYYDLQKNRLVYIYTDQGQLDDRSFLLICRIESENGIERSKFGLMQRFEAKTSCVTKERPSMQAVQTVKKLRKMFHTKSSTMVVRWMDEDPNIEWRYWITKDTTLSDNTVKPFTLLGYKAVSIMDGFGGIYFCEGVYPKGAKMSAYQDYLLFTCKNKLKGVAGPQWSPFFFGKIGNSYYCVPLEQYDYVLFFMPEQGIRFHKEK